MLSTETAFEFSSRRRNYLLTSHKRDPFIEWMKGMLSHAFVLDCVEETVQGTMQHFEDLFDEHFENPDSSELKRVMPSISVFFTRLPMVQAWNAYDAKYKVSKRKFVQCSFNEIRHILNLAQVMALKDTLKFISFDGDCTLYQDGKYFDNPLIAHALRRLLEHGCFVAIITAAGYGYQTEKYEGRLKGLVEYLAEQELAPEVLERFFVIGGECNYLMQMGAGARLRPVRGEDWKPEGIKYAPEDIAALLDVAEATLQDTIDDLQLQARLVRKEKAVGIIPGGGEGKLRHPGGHGASKLNREHLDEAVLRVQHALRRADLGVRYCAFNGGNDVFVDVGDKGAGVLGLQAHLGLGPEACLHVGDQFLSTGNDVAARGVCPTIWIKDPNETKRVLKELLHVLGLTRSLDDSALRSPRASTGGEGNTSNRSARLPPCPPSNRSPEPSSDTSSVPAVSPRPVVGPYDF
mmetsp:Transcript_5645/g.9734  ORF Transcript_5645/g.9734 Transcript_5645/m.9734 type:complete len:463 (+) Transcript_5645:21-1409(+)